MKILYLDFLHPKGHKEYNSNLIKLLSKYYDLDILTIDNYYDENIKENLKSVRFIERIDISKKKKTNSIYNRIESINIMLQCYKYIKNNKGYDRIIISSFDPLCMFISNFWLGINKKQIYIIHHNTVDQLKNSFKHKTFKTYMNKFNHIVLEKFIKTHMVENIGVRDELVNVIYHPLPKKINKYISKNPQKTIGKKYIACGLSGSNEEILIEKLLENEKDKNILSNNSINIILKSKKYSYDNGYLKIFRGYLDKEEYDFIINNSKIIVLPLSKTFNYRISAVFLESIVNEKIIITSKNIMTSYYKKQYPNSCLIYEDIDDLINILCMIKNNIYDINYDISLLNEYSELNILNQIKEAIDKVKE